MKKLILLLTLLPFTMAFSQSLPIGLDKIRLEKDSDYQLADSFALMTVNFLLSTPLDKNDSKRAEAMKFMVRWMTGTPDYSFTIGENVTSRTSGNDHLLGIYMACMVKYCLEHKSSLDDEKKITLHAVKLLLAYCEDPVNKVKMPKPLKELSEANKNGRLEREL